MKSPGLVNNLNVYHWWRDKENVMCTYIIMEYNSVMKKKEAWHGGTYLFPQLLGKMRQEDFLILGVRGQPWQHHKTLIQK